MNDFIVRIRETLSSFRRLARRWRLITIRKIFYLPHILSRQEKRLIVLLIAGALAGGIGLVTRAYLGMTHPVPAVSGSYTEGIMGNPRAINPLYASRDADRDLSRFIFSGILAYNGQGRIENDLAQKIEISRDGKTYAVFLKKNVRWHDGKPLDADDILFTLRAIQNPQYKSPFRANWQGVSMEKLDQYAVRFTLRSPYAPFIENLTQGIIPRHLWDSVPPDAAILHELNIKPVGSGPYRTGSSRQNNDGTFAWFEVSRNDSFYREGPYLKTIRLVFFDAENTAIQAWHKGDIEGFGPISASRIADLPQNKIALLPIQMPRIFSLFFNEKKDSDLHDVRVRQALAYAIDKNALAREATLGGGIAIDELLPPFGMHTVGNIQKYPYDPEAAKKLLAMAGWSAVNAEGIREKKIRQKGKVETRQLEITLSTSDWPELIRAAAAIRRMAKDAGIKINIAQKTFADLQDSVIRPRNFELLLFGQEYGYEPDPFAFWHSTQIKDPGLNVAMYASKKADKILADARRLPDAGARSQKYREFMDVASRDLPAIPLYTQLYLYLLPSDMRGVDISKISLPADRFNDVSNWYRQTTRAFF